MFQQIILYCLYKMEGERSITAPYYILQGKQSIQTIQDANLFHLNRFFTIYKQINKQVYDATIDQLKENQQLKVEGSDYTILHLTKEDVLRLQHEVHHYHFNGKKFEQIDTVFFDRLLLLIQVWTNKLEGKSNYIPIIENRSIEQWVKHVFIRTKNHVEENLAALYIEIKSLLSEVSEFGASIFVDQLTNAHIIGLSKQQLVDKYKVSADDITLETINVIHYMLEHIDEGQHPILSSVMKVDRTDDDPLRLTQSTSRTYELWRQGYALDEIARMRKLKMNTIYDHLVEIALHDHSFPYKQFLDQETIHEIGNAINHVKSFKLKEIKEHVPDRITYFQIRLTLTYIQKSGGHTS